MEKKQIFYGTPLNRSLNADQSQDGPINQRRARLCLQQTVRDSQGRQKFHGAFSGGFSAGYYNSVDSAKGFQPRQFITHRGHKYRDDQKNETFSHKPEDYMDEEDLGEFGIAPKKVRINTQYSISEDYVVSEQCRSFENLLQPKILSLGESILNRMNPASHQASRRSSTNRDIPTYTQKDDFHGIGYKSIVPQSNPTKSSKSTNPLIGFIDGGKRLKISGEAFGTGVLDDDEDDIDTMCQGYDNIKDYTFKPNQSTLRKLKSIDIATNENCTQNLDPFLIRGYKRAKEMYAIQLCDYSKYPIPKIPDDWTTPARKEVYIPPTSCPSQKNQSVNLKFTSRSSTQLNKKFITGSDAIKSDDIESKAGLVLYSDLKIEKYNAGSSENQMIDQEIAKLTTISRQEVEWRPCSLLCKRFNVPNPYPDNSFVGIRQSHSLESSSQSLKESSDIQEDKPINNLQQIESRDQASLEARRAIFDVLFDDSCVGNHKTQAEIITGTDSEDEPQVVELESDYHRVVESDDQMEEDDDDIVLVTAQKPKPEVIVLSSSSSSSSPTLSLLTANEGDSNLPGEHPDDSDTYGPPLPPSLEKLINLDHLHKRIPAKKAKKKKKKHKKSADDR